MEWRFTLQGLIEHAVGTGEHYDLLDRTTWSSGPWDKEPDAVAFQYHGLWCSIARHPLMGTLNGYVRVPAGHPWHGIGYEQLRHVVDVHGGPTFADCGDAGDEDAWYVGFDCGHSFDFMPNPMFQLLNAEYRTFGYVHEQCITLAQQAEKAAQDGIFVLPCETAARDTVIELNGAFN